MVDVKQVDRDNDRLKIARQAAADASIQLDDSQRGFNAAAAYLDGSYDNTSIAIRSALNAAETYEARIAELERERDNWREQFDSAAAAASEYSEFWELHRGDFDSAGNYIPHSQIDGDLRAAESRLASYDALVEALNEVFASRKAIAIIAEGSAGPLEITSVSSDALNRAADALKKVGR